MYLKYRGVAVIFFLLIFFPKITNSQPKGKNKNIKVSLPQKTLSYSKEELLSKLNSNDKERIKEALTLIANNMDRSMTPHIIALLNKGMPDEITEKCLELLGALGDPLALSTLISYTNHRRAEVRIIALQSLGSIKSASHRLDIVTAFENGLRDSNPEVRETAAQLIGETGIKEAIPVLFQAYINGVNEAAISIGKLGNREDSLRLAAYLGQRELDILLVAIGEFLKRDDFPEEGKRDLLDKLLEIAGPQVREFLVRYLSEIESKKEYQKIKKKVEEIISAIPQQ